MQYYEGRMPADPLDDAEVVYVDGERREALPLRLDVANHSPTGFSWGYNGSGPAQLALAILAHAMGIPEPADPSKAGDGTVASVLLSLVMRFYQDFKADFVARWPTADAWRVERSAVRTWLRLRNGGEN